MSTETGISIFEFLSVKKRIDAQYIEKADGKGYSYRCVALWRTEYLIENGVYIGRVAIDIPIEFVRIPHVRFLCSKVSCVYRWSQIHKIWLNNRRQRVQITGGVSSWSNISLDVPPKSVMSRCWSAPSLYLNQWWNSVNSNIRNKRRGHYKRN